MQKPVRVPNLRKVSMCCFQVSVRDAGLYSQHFVGLVVVQFFSSTK